MWKSLKALEEVAHVLIAFNRKNDELVLSRGTYPGRRLNAEVINLFLVFLF